MANYKNIVPAVYANDTVWLVIGSKVVTHDYASYLKYYVGKGDAVVFATIKFPFASDVVFESLLTPQFRLDNMWRADLLSHYHWTRYKTGIASTHERLDALMNAGKDLLPLMVPDGGREDTQP